MKRITTVIFVVAVISQLSTAQEPTNLGIFDATADWGIGGEFSEKLSEFKVSGKVVIEGDDENPVYHLYGNGEDGFLYGSDEAFYLYKQLEGSWTLTARLKWIEQGGLYRFGKVGLIVREFPKQSRSKTVNFGLVSGLWEPFGSGSYFDWRLEPDQEMSSTGHMFIHIWDEEGKQIGDYHDGLYCRISRYEPTQFIVGEWS